MCDSRKMQAQHMCRTLRGEEIGQEQKCTSKFMPAHYDRHESFAAEVRKEGMNLDRCMLYYCTGLARLGVAHGLSATQKLLVICLGRMY